MSRKIATLVVSALFLVVAYGADEKVRVYVTDSQSWAVGGGGGGDGGLFLGTIQGGARPQTAEIVKTFNQRCPQVIVTMRQDRADYIVVLDHEGGKNILRKDNKIIVFDKEGDAIFSGSTRSLGNAVKNACQVIRP